MCLTLAWKLKHPDDSIFFAINWKGCQKKKKVLWNVPCGLGETVSTRSSSAPVIVVAQWCGWLMGPATGWSKETVNCNFFLTGLKITKSGITEPFLVRAHREVLIFWCLEGVRWKKYPILGLCQNGGLAPARPDSAWTEPARHLQTLQDNPQTFLRIVWECLLVSFYAWFIFGNVRGHLGLFQGVLGARRCSRV